ncbi:MAG: ribosome biosis GTPase YqeH [Bacilli bacterium]|nr:ribosome biosis GTPase YqeH [Bacilli bacterium]
MELHCAGCGAPLQMEEPNQPGYITHDAMAKRENPVCRRCYRIIHYNEISPVPFSDVNFQRILASIGNRRALVLAVVDLFDFHGSWIDDLEEYIGNNPVVLVVNKADLLPRQTNFDRLESWLRSELQKKNIQPEHAFFVSAKTGQHVEYIKTLIESYANERDIYVVGTANVGKSTLINRLLSLFESQYEDLSLTTSQYPGTTLSTIQVEIPGYSKRLYDTPGLLTHHRLIDRVCHQSLKDITPTKPIDPVTYQLNERQTLFLGGLVRFDFIAGVRQPFVIYAANQLTVHRTKLENADNVYARHVGELLTPPCPECPDDLRKLVKHRYRFNAGPPTDIVISGIGWVSIRGRACEVRLHVPEGVNLSIRRAII